MSWINIIAIVQKDVLSQLILNIQKQLRELHNDCLLDSDKTQIKKEILSKYQLNIADLYNIEIDDAKN